MTFSSLMCAESPFISNCTEFSFSQSFLSYWTLIILRQPLVFLSTVNGNTSARCSPARAARRAADTGPRGQVMAGGSWREGPAREGRWRLQEVRAAAQREAAEGPAEGCHGFPDEAASATPVVRFPRLRSGRHQRYPRLPASEPSSAPQPHAF